MLDHELPDWQIVELSLALKLRAEDLEKIGRWPQAHVVVELRQRIIRSHVQVIPAFTTSELPNELGSLLVIEMCIALKLYAKDLQRRGCFSLCKEAEDLRRSLEESHVILTPFNSH